MAWSSPALLGREQVDGPDRRAQAFRLAGLAHRVPASLRVDRGLAAAAGLGAVVAAVIVLATVVGGRPDSQGSGSSSFPASRCFSGASSG